MKDIFFRKEILKRPGPLTALRVTTKPADPLKTMPVGFPAAPPAPGTATIRVCGLPFPS